MVRRTLPVLSSGLRPALERVVATTDRASRREADPVAVVREQADPLDAELAGLLASCMALGGARVARDKSRQALARLGKPLGASLDRPLAQVSEALAGWTHRFYRGEHAARLLVGARRVQRRHGTLGQRFGALLAERGGLEGALGAFVEEIQEAGWGETPLDAPSRHLLPTPTGSTSGCKRLMLYLRWMVRPDDGVDLGLWSGRVPTSALVIPVDVHILRLSRNLGLTTERQATWRAAREITSTLANFRPDDPVFYDFALCHLGMAQHCPSRRDPDLCDGCGVLPVCRHWTAVPSGRQKKRLRQG